MEKSGKNVNSSGSSETLKDVVARRNEQYEKDFHAEECRFRANPRKWFTERVAKPLINKIWGTKR